MTPDSDLSVVQRAGRIAAVQASLALAAVLLVVGAVVYIVDIRVQAQQITIPTVVGGLGGRRR